MQEPRIQQFFPRTAEKFFRPAVRLDQPVVSRIHDQDCFRSHLYQHPETGLALVQRLQRFLLRSDVLDDRKKVAGGTRILVSHRSEHNSDPDDASVFPDYPFLHRGSGDFACQQTAVHQIRRKIFGMDYVVEGLANQFIALVPDDFAQAMADHLELAVERQMSHAKPNQCERREEWLFVLPQGDALFVESVRHCETFRYGRGRKAVGKKQYKSELMFNANQACRRLLGKQVATVDKLRPGEGKRPTRLMVGLRCWGLSVASFQRELLPPSCASWWEQAHYATAAAPGFRQPWCPLPVARRTDCPRARSRSGSPGPWYRPGEAARGWHRPC